LDTREYIAVWVLQWARTNYRKARLDSVTASPSQIAELIGKFCGRDPSNWQPEAAADALKLLAHHGLANFYPTPHAVPRAVVDGDTAGDALDDLDVSCGALGSAVATYRHLGDDWLQESIFNSLVGVTIASSTEASDSNPPRNAEAWEPLEIERPDSGLDALIDALQSLSEAVRGDNGYAETQPAERHEVASRLAAATSYLRDAPAFTVSALQAYVIWPVEKLLSRFPAKSAIAVAAGLTKDVLVSWLKSKGIKFLDGLFN
jgi:hypothetical protein